MTIQGLNKRLKQGYVAIRDGYATELWRGDELIGKFESTITACYHARINKMLREVEKCQQQ